MTLDDDIELTVGGLIAALKEYDKRLPIRVELRADSHLDRPVDMMPTSFYSETLSVVAPEADRGGIPHIRMVFVEDS